MNPQEPQLLIVGEDFIAGSLANAEIDAMLGQETVLCGDQAIRGKGTYQLAPDYCSEAALTLENLSRLDILPLQLQTQERKKKPSKGFIPAHVVMFAIGDAVYVTKPQQTPSLALACALWFALSNR